MVFHISEVVGEDENSYKENTRAIINEMRKKDPDYSRAKNLMQRTLFMRVGQMDLPVAEVMERFPFLGEPELVSTFETVLFET